MTSRDHGLTFLIVIHRFPKFSGHSHCGSSDTGAKIFYVVLQNHVIKGSGDFMEGNSSVYIPLSQN